MASESNAFQPHAYIGGDENQICQVCMQIGNGNDSIHSMSDDKAFQSVIEKINFQPQKPAPLEMDEFIDKVEWEGGIEGFLEWGGPDMAPASVRPECRIIAEALEKINETLELWQDEVNDNV